MIISLLLAAALGAGGPQVDVVDAAGAGLAGAAVDFSDASGAHDRETTDASGHAYPRPGFTPVTALVTKNGYIVQRVKLAGAAVVVLDRVLSTVGSVAVATGSNQSLHRSPLAASVLDAAALANLPQTQSDRLLRELPGADRTRSNSAFTNYGQLRASFSGAGNDRGAVFVDGIPAQDGFGGQIDWQAYPGAALERAELLRGAGSSLYGSGAIGGALELDTFAPQAGRDAVAGGRLVVEQGSNGKFNGDVLMRSPLGKTLAAALVATTDRFSYADLAPGYTSPIDHPAVSTSGTTEARLRFSDGVTTVDASTLFASDHQDEGRLDYTFDRTERLTSLDASRALYGGIARVSYYERDATVYNQSDTYPAKPGVPRYVQHVPTHEDGFEASYAATRGPFDLQMRVDEKRVTGSNVQNGPAPAGALQTYGHGVETQRGLAVQTTYRSGRFEGTAGARADALRYDDLTLVNANASPAPGFTTAAVSGHAAGAISPRAALRYEIGSRLVLRASSGAGFRGPYLNELVRGFNIGATFMAPNPGLTPEYSRTDGAGFDYLLGQGRLALDFIETRVRDAIAYATISPSLMMYQNLDRTQSDSETLSYVAPLGTCSRLRLSGTTQTPRITSGPAASVGKQLAYVPGESADIGIDAAGRGPLGFSIDGSYAGQTYADNLQQQPLGPALLFGATLHVTTASGTTVTIVGDNLTRQAYLSSIDRYGPPQTVSVRLSIPLGSAGRGLTSSCH